MTHDDAKSASTSYGRAPVGRQTGEPVTNRHLSLTDLPQECRDHPDDIVIGRIRKSSREALEVRIRTIGSIGRVVMIRLCRQDKAGDWRPLNDSSRCGITIRAGLLSQTLDMLERAEDGLADEGVLPSCIEAGASS